jgi:hypothetical protein
MTTCDSHLFPRHCHSLTASQKRDARPTCPLSRKGHKSEALLDTPNLPPERLGVVGLELQRRREIGDRAALYSPASNFALPRS